MRLYRTFHKYGLKNALKPEQTQDSVRIVVWDKPLWTQARQLAEAHHCSMSWVVMVALNEFLAPGRLHPWKVEKLRETLKLLDKLPPFVPSEPPSPMPIGKVGKQRQKIQETLEPGDRREKLRKGQEMLKKLKGVKFRA